MRPFPVRVLIAFAAASAAAPGFAQADCTGPASAVRFYVDVENVRSSRGLVAVTLYPDDSRRFLARRGSLYVGRVPARAGTTRACIHLPSTGTWVFGVYHDEDGNRTVNRNSLGLPREGFGFSNNPRLLFSVPTFRSVRLAVPRTNMQTRIRLRYP